MKVATPFESVVAVGGDTTALTDVGTRATVLPVSGNPLPSLRITSTVALEWPSAGTIVRLATMSESATTGAVGGGVPKVTWTSSPTSGRLSVVSVARNRTVSEVRVGDLERRLCQTRWSPLRRSA